MLEYTSAFIVGAGIYSVLEILWRDFTHWSMALLGGLSTIVLYIIFNHIRLFFLKKLILGCVLITTLEFMTGVLVNIIFEWHIWDYSSQPYNVLGQICPRFSFYWLMLGIPAFFVCRGIRMGSIWLRSRRRSPA